MLNVDRSVQVCLWYYGRQVGVTLRWLLLADKSSCVSGRMVDRRMFLQGGCYRHVSPVVSLVLW